jgi:hypothetical protein
MPAATDETAGDPPGAGPGGHRSRLGAVATLRAEAPILPALLLAGLAVDLVWRAVAPGVARAGNPLERAAAVDGTLALIGVVAGIITGAAVLVRPGPQPPVRAGVTMLSAAAGASLAWWLEGTAGRIAAVLLGVAGLAAGGAVLAVGRGARRAAAPAVAGLVAAGLLWWMVDGLGASPLRAATAVLVWPAFTAITLFIGALAPGLSRRLEDGAR